MKITFLFILTLLLFSCTEQKPVQNENETEKETEEKDSLQMITKLDREKIRIYNTSISTIANAMKEKIFGTEDKKLTIEDLLETEIEFVNNNGDSMRIPLREVIDTIYYE